MANDTKLKPRTIPSISKPAPTSPVNPLKRKEPPGFSENEQKRFSPAPALPAGVTGTQSHQGEYEKGLGCTCKVCGTGVGFLNEETGGVTLKSWGDHRLTCSTPGQFSSDPVPCTPESAAEILANHIHLAPTKRRRAKRTEERINYLSADPYVAQFEAYRVLCSLCNKWIRLRPNSTYSLTPWDAHQQNVKSSFGRLRCIGMHLKPLRQLKWFSAFGGNVGYPLAAFKAAKSALGGFQGSESKLESAQVSLNAVQ